MFAKKLGRRCGGLFAQISRNLKRMSRNEILVLGDSHVDVFNHSLFSETFPQFYFNVVSVRGATASGLDNPNSITQTYKLFDVALRKYKGRRVVVMLGEVDTGFVIWYRAKKYDASVTNMVRLTKDTYERFLKDISEKFDLIVISAPLPTIQDGNDWGEVANERRAVTATQLERTKLTIDFNNDVQRFCTDNRIAYVNLDNDSIGANGLVRKELLNRNPRDHHFDQTVYAKLLIERLRPVYFLTNCHAPGGTIEP
jgi:hypothetical protein